MPMTRALIVIDIQNDYFPGGHLPLHAAEETEAGIVAAIGRAREAGDKIILVRHVSKAGQGLFSAAPGNEIRAAVAAAAAGAPVVTKHVADAFQDTDLKDHLQGVKDVLVCGMMTQNCVVFTAMSRSAEPLGVTVVSDLCTAPTEIVHRIALNALASKLKVSTAAELWP